MFDFAKHVSAGSAANIAIASDVDFEIHARKSVALSANTEPGNDA